MGLGEILWDDSEIVDDPKRSSAVDSMEGRDDIQRDLDRLKRWIQVNIMRFNKVRGKVLHLDWGNPRYVHRLGELRLNGALGNLI